jgi:hypothetical protein
MFWFREGNPQYLLWRSVMTSVRGSCAGGRPLCAALRAAYSIMAIPWTSTSISGRARPATLISALAGKLS